MWPDNTRQDLRTVYEAELTAIRACSRVVTQHVQLLAIYTIDALNLFQPVMKKYHHIADF